MSSTSACTVYSCTHYSRRAREQVHVLDIWVVCENIARFIACVLDACSQEVCVYFRTFFFFAPIKTPLWKPLCYNELCVRELLFGFFTGKEKFIQARANNKRKTVDLKRFSCCYSRFLSMSLPPWSSLEQFFESIMRANIAMTLRKFKRKYVIKKLHHHK